MEETLWDQLIIHQPNTVGIVSQQWVTPTLSLSPLSAKAPNAFDALDAFEGSDGPQEQKENKEKVAISPFDSQVADDFVIGPDETWTITLVIVTGALVNDAVSTLANVSFFTPSLSDPTIPKEQSLITFFNLPFNPTGGNRFQIPIPNLTLPSGTYWLSVQPVVPAAFDQTQANFPAFLWDSNQTPILNPAVYENPLDGFHSGFTTWTVTTAVANNPGLGPSQSFTIIGIRTVNPPCLHPDTQVLTLNGNKSIKHIKEGDFVIDHKGKPTKIVYNMIFSPKTNRFVSIPANSISQNVPDRDLLIRKDHPILYKGKEIDPLKFARKNKKTNLIKEITIMGAEEVWSLCTKTRTFVMMHNLPVATWEQNDWENNASKKMNVIWRKQ